MKTQYFLMLPVSDHHQSEWLPFAFNSGILSSISPATHRGPDNTTVGLLCGATHATLQFVTAHRLNIMPAVKSLFQIDAYWCALNQAFQKNTPSS